MEKHESLALIAGGVGITPFMSLLRHFSATGGGVPAVLVWANKTAGDVFHREELEAMTLSMPLRVVNVLSREAEIPGISGGGGNFGFERGRISADLLCRYLKGTEGFYLCGPPGMQDSVLEEIRRAFGLKSGRVSRELFFW